MLRLSAIQTSIDFCPTTDPRMDNLPQRDFIPMIDRGSRGTWRLTEVLGHVVDMVR